MRSIEQILESIENKKKRLTEGDKRSYGINNLRDARSKGGDSGSPIRGYNVSFDQSELTEHLTDREFRVWYNHKQRTVWNEIRQAGITEVICPNCNLAVQKPEDMMRWAGIEHHGKCFVESVETGKYLMTEFSKPYYERIKRVVFGL